MESQQSEAQITYSTEAKPKKKRGLKKLLLLLLLLLLCLVVTSGAGLGGWYYYEQQKESDETKTTDGDSSDDGDDLPTPVVTVPIYYYINCGFYKYENGAVENLTPKLSGYVQPEKCYSNISVVPERYVFSHREYNSATDAETLTNYDVDLKSLAVKKLTTKIEGAWAYSPKGKQYFVYNVNESKLYKLAEGSDTPQEIYGFKAEILGRGGAITDIVSLSLNVSEDKILINDTYPKYPLGGPVKTKAKTDITVVDTAGKKVAEIKGTNGVWIGDNEIAYHDQEQDSAQTGTQAIRKYDLSTKSSTEIYGSKIVPIELAVYDGGLYVNDYRSQDDTYRVVRVDLASLQAEVLSEKMFLGRVSNKKLVGLNLIKCNVPAEEFGDDYDELIAQGKYPCSPVGGTDLYTDTLIEIDTTKTDKPQLNLLDFTPQAAG